MKVFHKVIDTCLNVLATVAGLALGFLLIAICYSTFSRVVFRNPMSNLIEYSAYSLIYITFLGAPWILKQRGHITVDLILEMMSKKKEISDEHADRHSREPDLRSCLLGRCSGGLVQYTGAY